MAAAASDGFYFGKGDEIPSYAMALADAGASGRGERQLESNEARRLILFEKIRTKSNPLQHIACGAERLLAVIAILEIAETFAKVYCRYSAKFDESSKLLSLSGIRAGEPRGATRGRAARSRARGGRPRRRRRRVRLP